MILHEVCCFYLIMMMCGWLPPCQEGSFLTFSRFVHKFVDKSAGILTVTFFFFLVLTKKFPESYSFCILDCPSLFCFLFRCIGQKFQHIWPYSIRTGVTHLGQSFFLLRPVLLRPVLLPGQAYLGQPLFRPGLSTI